MWLERIVDVALDRAAMSGPKVDLARSLSIMRQAVRKGRNSGTGDRPTVVPAFPVPIDLPTKPRLSRNPPQPVKRFRINTLPRHERLICLICEVGELILFRIFCS